VPNLFNFENLQVWQDTRLLVKEVYVLTKQFPDDEKFGLTNQIRRAAISVSSNLAEGSSRVTDKDKAHFTNMAITSALEVIDHLIGAFDLEYITKEIYTSKRDQLDEIIAKLNSLYKYQLNHEEIRRIQLAN